MSDDEITRALEARLAADSTKWIDSTLYRDGQLVSTGQAIIEGHHGRYRTNDRTGMDGFPERGGVLKRMDTSGLLPLRDFVFHDIPTEPHYHFQIDRKR